MRCAWDWTQASHTSWCSTTGPPPSLTQGPLWSSASLKVLVGEASPAAHSSTTTLWLLFCVLYLKRISQSPGASLLGISTSVPAMLLLSLAWACDSPAAGVVGPGPLDPEKSLSEVQ